MQDRKRLTAAEVVRNFAVARDAALSGPVVITNHGRDSHVFMSFAEFAKSCEDNSTVGLENPLVELGEWLSEGIIVCDRNLVVTYVNRVAAAAIRKSAKDVIGRPLGELPGMKESHVLALVQRTNDTNEFASVEVASPLVSGRWTQMRCFPWRDRNVLLFADLTERMNAERMADAKRAILQAMNEHGRIGYARMSMRGTIESLDEPFADMIGLPRDRLERVPLVNLVAGADRVRMREALEAVMGGNVRQRLQVTLVGNDGGQIPVIAALAPLNSRRGIEGAVAVITPVG